MPLNRDYKGCTCGSALFPMNESKSVIGRSKEWNLPTNTKHSLIKGDEMTVKINPARVVFTLGVILILLFILNSSCYFLKFVVKYRHIHNFTLFNFDMEANIPTFFHLLFWYFQKFYQDLKHIGLKDKNINTYFTGYF